MRILVMFMMGKAKRNIVLFVILLNSLQKTFVAANPRIRQDEETNMLESLSDKKQRQLEKHFLQLLDMSKIPETDRSQTVPEYMKLLYDEQEIKNRDSHSTQESMSVVAVKASHVVEDSRQMRLKFDQFPVYSDDIHKVEIVLKVVHEKSRLRRHHGKPWQVTIRLCDEDDDCQKFAGVVHSRLLHGSSQLFETFDITDIVKSVPTTISENLEFELQLANSDERQFAGVQNEALLVLHKYPKINAPLEQQTGRSRRDAARALQSELRMVASGLAESSESDSSRFKRDTPCSHHRWFLNFTHMGWNSWIRIPEGYHANYCSGRCTPPLDDANSGINMTNHAFVSALYKTHISDTSSLPFQSCCVPIHLSPINIIFQNEKHQWDMRKMNEMQADYCGCL